MNPSLPAPQMPINKGPVGPSCPILTGLAVLSGCIMGTSRMQQFLIQSVHKPRARPGAGAGELLQMYADISVTFLSLKRPWRFADPYPLEF